MLMMLPFEAPTIFESIHKSYFRMPRVVKDQRSRFENDDLFRQLSHESAVKYTGFKDRPLEERQMKFIANCQEGHTEVSVVQTGNQFTLMFNPTANPAYNNEGCDFDKELGKVHIKAGFILNGVCVLWRGWIDLQRLEGFGCLEYDEYRAYIEDAMAKQQIDGKQPMCNNNSNAQASIRLNHHLGSVAPPPVGLNSNCLDPSTTHPGNNLSSGPLNASVGSLVAPQSQPPVSLADTTAAAAHYGNAAIAAAAAAAFHQALSVGAPGVSQSLHGLPGPPSAAIAAAAAAATAASNGLHGLPPPPPPPPHSLHPQHLTYTNNGSQIIPHHTNNTSPQHNRISPHQFKIQTNERNPSQTRSPERENHHNNNTTATNNGDHQECNAQNSKRQAIKRAQEDTNQIDEVDVVSDIGAHDLHYPPRRIFKADPITSHHNHHKISRRAA